MKELTIEDSLIELLAKFVANYSEETPRKSELSQFLCNKLEEKDLFSCLQQGLVTIDEAVDFIIGHVFTKYAKGESLELEENRDLQEVRVAVEGFVKSNL